jgi:hypothetical protein
VCVKSMLAFSVLSERSMPDSPWFFTLPRHIAFSFRRCTIRVQWHCTVSAVFEEFSIVSGDTQEASDVLTVLSLRPIHHCASSMILGVDAILVHIKAATIDFLTSTGPFCTLGLETVLCQKSKHFFDMYDVFCQRMAVNHNIVKVYNDEFGFHCLRPDICIWPHMRVYEKIRLHTWMW